MTSSRFLAQLAVGLVICTIQANAQATTIAATTTAPSDYFNNCTEQWSVWSQCFAGTSSNPTRWRDRRLMLEPAQKDAEQCDTSYSVNSVQVESCNDGTLLPIVDLESADCNALGFYKCANGRCIAQSLLCNGEDDCDDNSDEYPSYNSSACRAAEGYVCGFGPDAGETSIAAAKQERFLQGIPGINHIANGYDLLTGQYRSSVLTMAGHGSCRRVLVYGQSDAYYRIPANVGSFRQIDTLQLSPAEVFTSGASVIKSLQVALKDNLDFGGQLQNVSGSAGLTQQGGVKYMITQSAINDQAFTYVQQKVYVSTAEVILVDPLALQPSTDFIARVMELPYASFSNYKYLTFVQDFGTHYFTSARLGGQVDEIQVYSRCFLDGIDYEDYSDKPWSENLPECVRQSFYHSIDDTTSLSEECTYTDSSGKETYLHEKVVDRMISTTGGSIESASDLKFNFGKESWNTWVQSVKGSPSTNNERFQLREITDLMQSKAIPFESSARRDNVTSFLKQAVQIHLKAYDAEAHCEECPSVSDDSRVYYSDNEAYEGVRYVTGTGRDYQCICTYDKPPSAETCGALRPMSVGILTVIAMLFALKDTLL